MADIYDFPRNSPTDSPAVKESKRIASIKENVNLIIMGGRLLGNELAATHLRRWLDGKGGKQRVENAGGRISSSVAVHEALTEAVGQSLMVQANAHLKSGQLKPGGEALVVSTDTSGSFNRAREEDLWAAIGRFKLAVRAHAKATEVEKEGKKETVISLGRTEVRLTDKYNWDADKFNGLRWEEFGKAGAVMETLSGRPGIGFYSGEAYLLEEAGEAAPFELYTDWLSVEWNPAVRAGLH